MKNICVILKTESKKMSDFEEYDYTFILRIVPNRYLEIILFFDVF